MIRVGHRCDFSDRTPLTYAQSALREIGTPVSNTTGDVRPGASAVLEPPERPEMTPTTDILIIEDDAIMREALAEWLAGAGYGVRKAADGTAGLAAVKFAAPALVVTDIHMPGSSGATVIAELKRGYPDVPVIAISCLFNSGHGMDSDAAVALGAARALAKPFKRGELLRVVADLLGSPAG